jgi:hypothetical protein
MRKPLKDCPGWIDAFELVMLHTKFTTFVSSVVINSTFHPLGDAALRAGIPASKVHPEGVGRKLRHMKLLELPPVEAAEQQSERCREAGRR